LPARQALATRQIAELQPQVGAMRAHRGVPLYARSRSRASSNASASASSWRFHPGCNPRLPGTRCPAGAPRSRRRHAAAGAPRRPRAGSISASPAWASSCSHASSWDVRPTLPQQGIALLQRSRVPPPLQRKEVATAIGTFHVEQPPVEVAAAALAGAVDQRVAAGFEGDDCQRLAKFAQMADRGAVQPGLPCVLPEWRRPARCAVSEPGCHSA
jgi:hypothetical protein